MEIRAFTAADQTVARSLILEGLGERFGSIDESLTPDLNDIMATYLAAGHTFLVAEDVGALVGTAALLFEPDGATCQLVRVSVRPEARRQGTARALVETLLALARERRRRMSGWRHTSPGTTPSRSMNASASSSMRGAMGWYSCDAN